MSVIHRNLPDQAAASEYFEKHQQLQGLYQMFFFLKGNFHIFSNPIYEIFLNYSK